MDLRILPKHKLINSHFDIKEDEIQNKKNLVKSLKNYGQIFPLIVTQKKDKFLIIKGNRIYHAMNEIGLNTFVVNVINIEDDFQLLNFKNNMLDTISNIDVLKFSLIIKELNKQYSINEIESKTGIKTQQLLNYIDLTKLDNLIKQNKQSIQTNLF
jgi:ParB-like chromosome segregation protein Spo0J